MTGAGPARFRGSDAEFNIGCAIGAVQSLPSGVYIAMNGRIFDPQHVRKNVAANGLRNSVPTHHGFCTTAGPMHERPGLGPGRAREDLGTGR